MPSFLNEKAYGTFKYFCRTNNEERWKENTEKREGKGDGWRKGK